MILWSSPDSISTRNNVKIKKNVGKNKLEMTEIKSSPDFRHFMKTVKTEEQLLQEISADNKR